MSPRRMQLMPDQLLIRRTMRWARKLRVNPAHVEVTELPAKWGSCSPDGVITLTHDLVEMSEEFQDYVVVHELLHLRYRGHGRAFTAMMTATIPGWRELERSSPSSEPGSDPAPSVRS